MLVLEERMRVRHGHLRKIRLKRLQCMVFGSTEESRELPAVDTVVVHLLVMEPGGADELGRPAVRWAATSTRRCDAQMVEFGNNASIFGPEDEVAPPASAEARFCVAGVIGDGEEVIQELCDLMVERRESGMPRAEVLRRMGAIEGVYVPALYDEVENGFGFVAREPRAEQPCCWAPAAAQTAAVAAATPRSTPCTSSRRATAPRTSPA